MLTETSGMHSVWLDSWLGRHVNVGIKDASQRNEGWVGAKNVCQDFLSHLTCSPSRTSVKTVKFCWEYPIALVRQFVLSYLLLRPRFTPLQIQEQVSEPGPKRLEDTASPSRNSRTRLRSCRTDWQHLALPDHMRVDHRRSAASAA